MYHFAVNNKSCVCSRESEALQNFGQMSRERLWKAQHSGNTHTHTHTKFRPSKPTSMTKLISEPVVTKIIILYPSSHLVLDCVKYNLQMDE